MNLENVYKNRFGLVSGVQSLGWGSFESQQIRFKILLDINGYKCGDSVLDVGCGLGDLSQWIGNYTGIDLRPSIIIQGKKLYPDARLFCCGTKSIHSTFDWVFASGIFCFRKGWEKRVRVEIREMLRIASKGVAINFLSNRSRRKKRVGMKYADVGEVVSLLGGDFHRFVVRHDYLENDFTVYIFKY